MNYVLWTALVMAVTLWYILPRIDDGCDCSRCADCLCEDCL